MTPGAFVSTLEALADETEETRYPIDTEQWERMLRSTMKIVFYELEGLEARLAAKQPPKKVNDYDRRVPKKPYKPTPSRPPLPKRKPKEK